MVMMSQRRHTGVIPPQEEPDLPIFKEELEGHPSLQARDKHRTALKRKALTREKTVTEKAYNALQLEQENVRKLENDNQDLLDQSELLIGLLIQELRDAIDILEKQDNLSDEDQAGLEKLKKHLEEAIGVTYGRRD